MNQTTKAILSDLRRMRFQQHRFQQRFTAFSLRGENSAALRPFMDFEDTFGNREELQKSILRRRMNINLKSIFEKYTKFKNCHDELREMNKEREKIAERIKSNSEDDDKTEEQLVEMGRKLRNEYKALKENFFPIEEEFIQIFLSLPNKLHVNCPVDNIEKVIYRYGEHLINDKKRTPHLLRGDLVRFIDNSRYYLLQEAAEFDTSATLALTRYFVSKGGFYQMANPDFVRCILLEANATPPNTYHQVVEDDHRTNAAFLTGGGAFESFLGAITKLCVHSSVLPLRFVSTGRCYYKNQIREAHRTEENLYTTTQTNAVQTFIASETAQEANDHMESILNLCVNFYKLLGIPFRIVYADASALTPSESLRAVIEVYSAYKGSYICVGHISNYGNYVSKRIVFAMRKQKDYHFLHIVGGPVMYTSRLIAALIEIGADLSKCLFLDQDNREIENRPRTGIEEFKKVFK